MMSSTLPYLTSPTSTPRSVSDHKKLRSACDACHQCKVKCSGGSPCFRCTTKGLCCRYGYQNRAGKPKGSKNRKTLEREHQLRMEWLTSQLRDANGGLGDMNIDLTASTLLPSPSFQPSDWKQGHVSLQSSIQPTPADQCIKSTEHESECLPSPHALDTWTMDLAPVLQTPRESTSDSFEGFTTPISLTDDAYLRQLTDTSTPRAHESPSPDARLDRAEDPCPCVQTQAVNISTLHQLTCRNMSNRFDLAMKSITSTLETCEKFIACNACDKSFSSILLTLSAIELIFKLFEQLTKNNRGLSPPEDQRLVPCSLGDYKVTREEGQAIRNVLVKMTLSKGRQTLDALQNLVDRSGDSADQHGQPEAPRHDCNGNLEPMLHGLSLTDRDYMTQCIGRKNAALEILMAAVVV
ncbi:hypothetical protein BJX96DRAFT_159368 [Aspergillus floccosus]